MALLLKGGHAAYVLCEDWDTLHVKIQCDIIIIPQDRTCVLTTKKADHFIIQLRAFDVDSVMEIKGYSFSGS
jgi:hypothetical protein